MGYADLDVLKYMDIEEQKGVGVTVCSPVNTDMKCTTSMYAYRICEGFDTFTIQLIYQSSVSIKIIPT